MRTLLSVLVVGLVGACAVPGSVVRVDPRSTIDLSGRWNDADANMAADTLVADCLGNGWAERFASQHAATSPVVRVYRIRNRSADHLNDRFFTKQVEAALLQSGHVRTVADPEESADNRFERGDQALFASPETAKAAHQETGADYVLNGWVIGQDDQTPDATVKAYLVTMELSDATTNEKVWIGTRQIKKLVLHGE